MRWTDSDLLATELATRFAIAGSGRLLHLLRRIAEQGTPEDLRALGFVGAEDFWASWCAALHKGEIASLAFSARLTNTAAEPGVVTVPALRGLGYASAATAGWAALPELRKRTLFYSTQATNIASRRVAERLGLRFLGASLTIA